MVDYGMLTLIQNLYSGYLTNYTILLATVGLGYCKSNYNYQTSFLPLTAASYKSMAKMKAVTLKL